MEKIKYHPILFSTPMVQAILELRKNKTRRTKGLDAINKNPELYRYDGFSKEYGMHYFERLDENGNPTENYHPIECPYNLGDILWVRESFHYVSDSETREFIKYGYRADWNDGILTHKKNKGIWKPSIHMPKQACRIFLKIKSIRAERLQDINEEDAIAEGAIQYEAATDWMSAKYGFQMIWETINGKESWCFNPFVWVYEFERIEKPNDFLI